MKRILAIAVLVLGSFGLAACGSSGSSDVTYYPITQCGPYPYSGVWLYAFSGGFSGGRVSSSSSSSSGSSSSGGGSSGSVGRAGGGGAYNSGGTKAQSNFSGGGPRGASKGGGGPGSNYSVSSKGTYVIAGRTFSTSRTPSAADEIAATSARRNIVLGVGVARPPYRTYLGGPGLYCYQVWYPIGQHPRHEATTTIPPTTTTAPAPPTTTAP